MDQDIRTPAFSAFEVCPMAPMCNRILQRSNFGVLAVIPALALITAGVLVLVEPRILIWLIGGASILAGLGILTFATFARSIFARASEVRG